MRSVQRVSPAPAALVTAALIAVCAGPAQGQQPEGQMGLEQRLKQLDRDGDGKLAPQELPGEWFGRLDADKDGVVTLEDTNAALGAQTRQAAPPAPAAQQAVAATRKQDFVPDAPFVGEINGSYIDPEFSEGANQVVF